ncbi:MAG TPA: pyridoxal-phosphate dependent enzyme [Gaiellaceae bacterium]|nr:pyridoxal-phosphate dependent enzyme [Gaiellaceae bacterium]
MRITLGEGSTPLLRAPRLSERFGVELWLKWEGANPTGSFKDRGMAVAVSRAVEQGAHTLVCASTGNTAASCAAYAARAGLRAVIVVAAGAAAGPKLLQVRAVGGEIVEIDGSFTDAFAHAEQLGARDGHVLVNSTNPHRIEGQKTAAFEILEQLGGVPDVLTLPYGGGGNTKAYALGFGERGPLPRLHPVQAAERATTVASAIRIVEPVHRVEAERAVAESGGAVHTLGDQSIVEARRLLGREEGLFCEPASAAGIAALPESARSGERVVCVITGHGLKDPA